MDHPSHLRTSKIQAAFYPQNVRSRRVFVSMGSFDLAHQLRIKCPCGRRCFPELGPLCVQCDSSARYTFRCFRSVARHSLFNKIPPLLKTYVVEFVADSAAHPFYIAILDYILLATGSPLRAFRFVTNRDRPIAGNISETEDILDRILSFL